MKILHTYLIRQVLATLMMTVAVFTFVLLLGNGLKEILVLIINRQATLGGVIQAFGLLIPFVLVFALPMGMLTAALLVFGRFSADQELTAVKSSGVSLLSLITPILGLSLVLCGVSAAINMEIAPRCRIAYLDLRDEMVGKVAGAALPDSIFVKDFPGFLIYVGASDGKNLTDIHICQLDENDKVKTMTDAPKGLLQRSGNQTSLELFDARIFDVQSGSWAYPGIVSQDLSSIKTNSTSKNIHIGDMTFRQLQNELQVVENEFAVPEKAGSKAELQQRRDILANKKKDVTMPIRVQMHRQVAFSFACFGFTLIGIPLGIQAHRRETNVGIAMSLALVLVYYSFIILGQSFEGRPYLAPHLILWIPNFLFQAIGAVMLWRANRGI
ncbi:LptF/LptG family permease [Pedosphaera parvula]|uniref:Permease YjgP/YjgQ family protein n=1 Tax=Pedosphaera parvula (strain Ellin514) TaxID=320771 RepID=B9XL84_PEDPL|nr:LptF/LptG family permease [Pedosphaera parvula]EEF59435.1 permease YjgP/YjgQ family protein [Pedosphaera parvula Ellin514]